MHLRWLQCHSSATYLKVFELLAPCAPIPSAGTLPRPWSSLTASWARWWCPTPTGRRGRHGSTWSETLRATSTRRGALTLVVRWGAKDAGADGAAAWHTAAGWLAVVCRAVVHSMCNAHFPNSCLHATSPCCRLEHVGESLRAAQQAASKEVTAAAMSLLEAPPADLWPRLGKVHACELAWEAG